MRLNAGIIFMACMMFVYLYGLNTWSFLQGCVSL